MNTAAISAIESRPNRRRASRNIKTMLTTPASATGSLTVASEMGNQARPAAVR